jgi:hypothetical protein
MPNIGPMELVVLLFLLAGLVAFVLGLLVLVRVLRRRQ